MKNFLQKHQNQLTQIFSYLTGIHPWLKRFGMEEMEHSFKKISIHSLNVSQFFGVLNDNIFKFLIVYLFIDLQGVEKSSQILFIAGTVYVLPFLLFSAIAGNMADWFSKQKIIAVLKITEVIIMFFGMIAFAIKSAFLSYSLLFLLSLQSALFGPAKLSIIAELVPQNQVSKSNGLIASSTYLAIILGTFLASSLTQLTNRNFVLTAFYCLIFALIGYLASLLIPQTQPSKNKRKINPFFIIDIYKTLVSCRFKPYLLMAIFGSAFFLFIGAFFQLNVIPFAMESLGLSEVGGGYLFTTTAIGIAVGATVGGRISKARIELGLPCVAINIMTWLIWFLVLFSFSLTGVLVCLLLIGMFGGMFIVPLDSYIQTASPEKNRGQIIASANFLSFVGVLIAPLSIKLLNGTFGLSAGSSFFIISWITYGFGILLVARLASLFFNYVCRLILFPFANVSVNHFPFQNNQLLALVDAQFNWLHVIFLASYHPNIQLYLMKSKKDLSDFFITRLTGVRFVYEKTPEDALKSYLSRAFFKGNRIPCLILSKEPNAEAVKLLQEKKPFLLEQLETYVLSRSQQKSRMLFKRTQITMTISSKTPLGWHGAEPQEDPSDLEP